MRPFLLPVAGRRPPVCLGPCRRLYCVSIHTGALMIGSASLKQERAIKFMQFLAGSEGGRLTRWGIESVHYERRENGSVRFIGDYRYPENYLFDGGTEKRRMAGIDYWLLMENPVANGLLDALPGAYYTNSDRIALRAMEIRAGQRYKGYAAKDRCAILRGAARRPRALWASQRLAGCCPGDGGCAL